MDRLTKQEHEEIENIRKKAEIAFHEDACAEGIAVSKFNRIRPKRRTFDIYRTDRRD